MKKILKGKVIYYGQPARITAKITDVDGYISITGEIIPYRCKTVHCCGCLHDYIVEAFQGLRPFIWLHLVNLDGSVMHEVENSLYMLANDDIEAAKVMLHATDAEIQDLYNLVYYGLHREKTWWGYKDNKTGYHVKGDGVRVYAAQLAKLNLKERRLRAIDEFYKYLGV